MKLDLAHQTNHAMTTSSIFLFASPPYVPVGSSLANPVSSTGSLLLSLFSSFFFLFPPTSTSSRELDSPEGLGLSSDLSSASDEWWSEADERLPRFPFAKRHFTLSPPLPSSSRCQATVLPHHPTLLSHLSFVLFSLLSVFPSDCNWLSPTSALEDRRAPC